MEYLLLYQIILIPLESIASYFSTNPLFSALNGKIMNSMYVGQGDISRDPVILPIVMYVEFRLP